MHNANIKPCTLSQVQLLQEIAIKTYYETFSDTNSEALLQSYFEASLNIKTLSQHLVHPHSAFYFIYAKNDTQYTTPAGFLKLNINDAQSDLMDPTALEVEKIYLLDAFLSQGLGKQMIEFSITQAKQKNKSYLWLGVWENNFPAIKFYQKMGFEQFSTHNFDMGGDIQTDWLMKRKTVI